MASVFCLPACQRDSRVNLRRWASEDARLHAVACVRGGGMIGLFGVPDGELPANTLLLRNVGLKGGPAPVRAYLPDLPDLLDLA